MLKPFKTIAEQIELFTKLDNSLQTISVNDILHSLGFPTDWHKKSVAMP